MIDKNCKNCGKFFQARRSSIEEGKRLGKEWGIFCSKSCKSTGKFHHKYNGGLVSVSRECNHCKKLFVSTVAETRYRPVKYCSYECTWQSKRVSKRGYVIDTRGYKELYLPQHPKVRNGAYYLEHRYVVEQHIGRILEKNEHVHHINRNKLDNRIGNLVILTPEQHAQEHVKDRNIAVASYWTEERRREFGEKIRSYRKTHFWTNRKVAL